MALDANILGHSLYEAATAFNDRDLVDLEAARREFWNSVSTVIIDHFKTNGVVLVPGTGLTAGPYPVLGQASGQIT